MRKKKNPVIQTAEQRGYEKGFKVGNEHGRGQSIAFILDWFERLENVHGIGPKTAKKIQDEFLKKYGEGDNHEAE